MDQSKYNVVFTGRIREGEDLEDVKKALTSTLNVNPANLGKLFSGKRIIIKKGADIGACQRLKHAMEKAGALVTIEPQSGTPPPPRGASSNEAPGRAKPPPLPPRTSPIRAGQAASLPQKGPDEKFCNFCGGVIKMNALSCPYCGKVMEKRKMGCLPKAAIALGIGVFALIPIGIIAAIAIPQFVAYRNRAYEAEVKKELTHIVHLERAYQARSGYFTRSLEELGYEIADPMINIEITSADQDCFEAAGTHESIPHKEIRADCNGLKGVP